jgi:NADH-quinone oxidoreductase subunit A
MGSNPILSNSIAFYPIMSFIFLEPFLKPVIFFIFNCLIAFLIIILSFFFSDANPYVEKVSAYECGFEPDEDARNVFDIRFYIIAMLFLVFDLEAIFFFP